MEKERGYMRLQNQYGSQPASQTGQSEPVCVYDASCATVSSAVHRRQAVRSQSDRQTGHPVRESTVQK